MPVAASAALLILVLGLTGGSWHPWAPHIPAIIPAGRFPIAVGLAMLTISAAWSLVRHGRMPTAAELSHPVVWSSGLVALFLSDWLLRPWGFFPDPFIRGQLVVAAAIFAWMLSTRWHFILPAWLVVSLCALIWTFFAASGGELLVSDDHAMFLFRLKLLKENFPLIPFWSPLWNAGFDARDFFATGALNAFLIASPIVYLFEIERSYNAIVSLLLWGVVPGASYLACRMSGGSRAASAAAGALSISVSLIWYRWALKYGTIGFITSAGLFPLAVALWNRFLESASPRWRDCIFTAIVSTLMFLWSPSTLALAPMGLFGVLCLPRIIRSPRHIITLALIVALNLPWVAIMWKVSNVGSFLNAEGSGAPSAQQAGGAPEASQRPEPLADAARGWTQDFRHKTGSLNIRRAMRELHTQASAMNPLLLVFGIPALLMLSPRRRAVYGLLVGWLVALGTLGVSIKPQLELDRMGLMAGTALATPVALFLAGLFSAAGASRWLRGAAIVSGAFLLASPLAASSVVANQSSERYRFQNEEMRTVTRILAERTGAGRGFFTGCVLHEMSGGHLAPMALWANAPLVASSYAHNIWQYQQPVPKSFLDRGNAGVLEYLDLMNASVVLAHEPTWISFCNSLKDDFEMIHRDETFAVYSRPRFKPNFALEGSLSGLSMATNSVTFTPESERVVLKFRHFPFLASSQCALRPIQVAPEVALIELSGCSVGEPVTITSVSPLERLLSPRGGSR